LGVSDAGVGVGVPSFTTTMSSTASSPSSKAAESEAVWVRARSGISSAVSGSPPGLPSGFGVAWTAKGKASSTVSSNSRGEPSHQAK